MLVVGEELLAVKTVGQSREAAARHAGNDIDCIEQARLGAVRCDDLGTPEKLQNAIRKRSSSCAAAREGKDDEVVLALEVLLAILKRVPAINVDLCDRRVDRTRGATAQQQQQGKHR